MPAIHEVQIASPDISFRIEENSMTPQEDTRVNGDQRLCETVPQSTPPTAAS